MSSRRLIRTIPSSINRTYSTSSTIKESILLGSAPQYSHHLIIHGPSFKTWPSHFESVSPLFKALSSRFGNHQNPNMKLGFTFADLGGVKTSKDRGWDNMKGKLDEPEVQEEEEIYSATLYPNFLPVNISISTLNNFESTYLSLTSTPASSSITRDLEVDLPSIAISTTDKEQVKNVDIFVCVHSRRDCRCGDLGEPLFKAIQREIAKRRLGNNWNVTVSRIAHIGGHKYAGNVLVYQEGGSSEWYGLLRETDASKLVESVLSESSEPLYDHWRGRLGLTSEEIKSMYESRVISQDLRKKKKERKLVQLGDPVELKFKSYEGEVFTVTGYENESVMDAAVRADLPSIVALCGGVSECATCHCMISRQEEAHLPPISDEEEEQLDFAMGRSDDSRLSCQIPITAALGEWVKKGGIIDLPRY